MPASQQEAQPARQPIPGDCVPRLDSVPSGGEEKVSMESLYPQPALRQVCSPTSPWLRGPQTSSQAASTVQARSKRCLSPKSPTEPRPSSKKLRLPVTIPAPDPVGTARGTQHAQLPMLAPSSSRHNRNACKGIFRTDRKWKRARTGKAAEKCKKGNTTLTMTKTS